MTSTQYKGLFLTFLLIVAIIVVVFLATGVIRVNANTVHQRSTKKETTTHKVVDDHVYDIQLDSRVYSVNGFVTWCDQQTIYMANIHRPSSTVEHIRSVTLDKSVKNSIVDTMGVFYACVSSKSNVHLLSNEQVLQTYSLPDKVFDIVFHDKYDSGLYVVTEKGLYENVHNDNDNDSQWTHTLSLTLKDAKVRCCGHDTVVLADINDVYIVKNHTVTQIIPFSLSAGLVGYQSNLLLDNYLYGRELLKPTFQFVTNTLYDDGHDWILKDTDMHQRNIVLLLEHKQKKQQKLKWVHGHDFGCEVTFVHERVDQVFWIDCSLRTVLLVNYVGQTLIIKKIF